MSFLDRKKSDMFCYQCGLFADAVLWCPQWSMWSLDLHHNWML